MAEAVKRNVTKPGRAARVKAWFGRHPRAVMFVLLGILSATTLGAGLLAGSWQSVCRDCPSVAQITMWEPKASTKVFDRENRLIEEFYEERRTPIEIETLPDYVKMAFVAVEDRRFYTHEGLDYRRIFGAAIRNVLSGEITGGASTITQQLARNMFEGIGFEQRLARKLKEARVAREIETVYSKDEILQAYINQVNYGHGWRGIETASQHYFGKAARDINPAEAAMLAAAINAPGRYSPFINAERTLSRRNLVLGLMAQQGYLPREELAQWRAEPLPESRFGGEVGKVAPYFIETVRGMLDSRYGSDLYNKGLRVYTTLDLDMQRAAESAMEGGWESIETAPGYRAPRYAAVMADKGRKKGNETPYLQGAFIAMDSDSGDVRALVGGRDFADSKFNRATQAQRQAGSTFKPFVYAAAIASGIPASHVMYDAPLAIPMSDNSIYSPKNYDPDFLGPLTLRDAMRVSVNTIAVQLGLDVGLENVARTAKEYGITTDVPAYPSTSIGAASVIPMELTTAYSVFSNAGIQVQPRYIVRVEDSQGRVLWRDEPDRKRVANEEVTSIVRDMMSTVVNNGSGYPARDPAQGGLPRTVPAGGKTGTTNDGTDVWFAGFTPDLVATVWFGFDRPRTIVGGAAGGRFAAPVWGRFMRAVYTGDTPELPVPEPWGMPSTVVARQVDRDTGKLVSEVCSLERSYTEYYIAGTEPTELCDPYMGGGGLFGAPLGQPVQPVPDTINRRP